MPMCTYININKTYNKQKEKEKNKYIHKKPQMKIYIIYIKLTRWARIVEDKTPTEGRVC